MFVLRKGDKVQVIIDLYGKCVTATIDTHGPIQLRPGEQARISVMVDDELFDRVVVARCFPPIAAMNEKEPVLLVAMLHDEPKLGYLESYEKEKSQCQN